MKIIHQNNLYYLELNDKRVSLLELTQDDPEEMGYYLGANLLVENDELCSYSDIADIKINKYPDSLCFTVSIENVIYEPLFVLSVVRKNNNAYIKGHISYDLSGSPQSIHPKKAAELAKNKLIEINAFDIKGPAYEADHFFVQFSLETSPELSLRNVTNELSTFLADAQTNLVNQLNILEGITTKITIPDEYKHTFAQYLAYFGEFLADLGIDAETAITTKKNELLLSISPNNKDEAIENIYLALASYLSLADESSEALISPTEAHSAEMKFQQLMSQVKHLKSQLKMTEHIAYLQEKHINLLEASAPNNQTVLIDKETKNQVKQNEYWAPVEGIKITKYKGKFFEIDIPALIKKLTKAK